MTDQKHKISSAAVKQVLLDYWRQYRLYPYNAILAVLAPSIGNILVFFAPPLIVAQFINKFSAEGISLSSSWHYIALFGSLWFMGEICWRIGLHNLISLEAKSGANLSKKAFKKLSHRDYAFYTDNFVGSLTKMTNAYSRGFEIFSDTICFNLSGSLITMAFAIVVLSYYSIWISIILVFCLGVAIAIAVPLIRKRSSLVADRHMASSKVSGRLSDSLSNIMAIKSFASEGHELKTYSTLVDEYTEKYRLSYNFQNLRFDMSIFPVYVLTNVIGLILSIFISEKFALPIGTVFVVFSYYSRVTGTFWEINRIYRNIESSVSEAAEFTQMFLTPPRIHDSEYAGILQISSPSIGFKNIQFRYDEADKNKPSFLNGFDLDIKPYEKVGLVGPSGSGKTTVTKLLLRFIEPQSGHISIDGQDTTKITQSSLRQNISYVPQEPLLFHRSLFENISYGSPDATMEDVVQASKIAHAHEFITSLPKGYETMVGERGVKLSGGQRQRVAIARALLKKAPILILDEATSSLDSESEKYIQEGLHELMKDKTALIIAHRLSTIKNLDRIVVMDKGKVVESGTHDELIAKSGPYARLWSHQSGEFIHADETVEAPILC